jgi:hypothetical protein
MMNDKDLMTVTIRSFVPLDEPTDRFEPGKPFDFDLPRNTALGELVKNWFSDKMNQIGIMAVNGQIASDNVILSQGDKIDLYPLLDGG